MAMMSLRVNQGPSLNLSGIFKNAMSDPSTVAQMELAKSRIWNDYYDNLLKQQQTEEQRQLAIKTGQEAATLAAQQKAKDAAAGPYGQTLADAIHDPTMPVPVDHTPPAAQSLIGPGMPYISSDQRATYDAGMTAAENQRKSQRLLGPAIVQLGKDANDLAQGTGRASGNAILLGNPTPAEARTGATLSTGNLPSTSTVVTAGDTAGTDAAARQAIQEAAGKLPYDAALAQVKAEAEANAKVAARPLGDSELAIYRAKLAELEAKPPGQLTPQDQAILPLLKDAVGKATQTSLDANNRLVAPDPANPGAVAVVPGSEPTVGADAGAYGDLKSLAGRNFNIVSTLMDKLDAGGTLTRAEMRQYSAAFNQLWGAKIVATQDAAGVSHEQTLKPDAPFGFYAPEDIMAAGGKKPGTAGPAPAIAPTAAVTPADGGLVPAVTPTITAGGVTDTGPTVDPAVAPVAAATGGPVVDPITTPTRPTGSGTVVVNKKPIPGLDIPSPATADAAKAKLLSPALARAHASMRDTPAGNLPDAWFNYWANPQDPGLLQQIIEQQVPAAQRQYAQQAAQFGLVLYQLSGAAFPGGEYPRIMRTMIPTAADNPVERRNKLQLQAEYVNGLVNNGWNNNPGLKQQVRDQFQKELGMDFTDAALLPPVKLPEDRAAPAAPVVDPNLPPVPANLTEVGGKPEFWPKYTPAARAFFIEQAAKKAQAK